LINKFIEIIKFMVLLIRSDGIV